MAIDINPRSGGRPAPVRCPQFGRVLQTASIGKRTTRRCWCGSKKRLDRNYMFTVSVHACEHERQHQQLELPVNGH
jgi:hypothetical protein